MATSFFVGGAIGGSAVVDLTHELHLAAERRWLKRPELHLLDDLHQGLICPRETS